MGMICAAISRLMDLSLLKIMVSPTVNMHRIDTEVIKTMRGNRWRILYGLNVYKMKIPMREAQRARTKIK